jgi:hypothetical protein
MRYIDYVESEDQVEDAEVDGKALSGEQAFDQNANRSGKLRDHKAEEHRSG